MRNIFEVTKVTFLVMLMGYKEEDFKGYIINK